MSTLVQQPQAIMQIPQLKIALRERGLNLYSKSHKQEKDPHSLPPSCSGPTPAGCAMKENSCSADHKEPQSIKACSHKDNNANYKDHTITKTKMKL